VCDSIQSKADWRYFPKQSREGIWWVITDRELQQLCFQGPSADNASNRIPTGATVQGRRGGGGGNHHTIPHLPLQANTSAKQKRWSGEIGNYINGNNLKSSH